MSRLVRKPVSFLSLALVFIAPPIWWHFRLNLVVAQAPAEQSAVERTVALARAGLDAKTLAAAGLSATATTSAAQAARAHMNTYPTALTSAETALASARRESDRLLRLIQAGRASQQDVANYQTQKAAFDSATAQRQAALDAIFEAATANLTTQQRATLTAIRANSAQSEVPVEFRTVMRSKAEWLQWRDDLATERVNAREGLDPFAEGAARLAAARADSAVAAAKSSLDSNLTAVASALQSAVAVPSDH